MGSCTATILLAAIWLFPGAATVTAADGLGAISGQVAAGAQVAGAGALVAVHVSDYNRAWYDELGWNYDADLDGLRSVLEEMKLPYTLVDDAALAAGFRKREEKLLILLNARRMSAAQVRTVREFVAGGGRLFAMYQASFRSEADLEAAREGFQLADLFGVSFAGWQGSPPLNGYIRRTVPEGHPLWAGLPEFVGLPGHAAMVVKLPPGERLVAGEWFNDDRLSPSHPEADNAAIVLKGRVAYAGGMLLAPENLAEPGVRGLVANIIAYLLQME